MRLIEGETPRTGTIRPMSRPIRAQRLANRTHQQRGSGWQGSLQTADKIQAHGDAVTEDGRATLPVVLSVAPDVAEIMTEDARLRPLHNDRWTYPNEAQSRKFHAMALAGVEVEVVDEVTEFERYWIEEYKRREAAISAMRDRMQYRRQLSRITVMDIGEPEDLGDRSRAIVSMIADMVLSGEIDVSKARDAKVMADVFYNISRLEDGKATKIVDNMNTDERRAALKELTEKVRRQNGATEVSSRELSTG